MTTVERVSDIAGSTWTNVDKTFLKVVSRSMLCEHTQHAGHTATRPDSNEQTQRIVIVSAPGSCSRRSSGRVPARM